MTTTSLHPAGSATAPLRRTWLQWRSLIRHYIEMVVAMFAGMLVLGALREVTGLNVAFAEQPGTSFLLMATDMTIAMVAWMLLRGHDWAATLEMCAAMYLPVALLPLLWSGALGSMTFMVLAHVLMMAAMLAVLLRRRDHPAHC